MNLLTPETSKPTDAEALKSSTLNIVANVFKTMTDGLDLGMKGIYQNPKITDWQAAWDAHGEAGPEILRLAHLLTSTVAAASGQREAEAPCELSISDDGKRVIVGAMKPWFTASMLDKQIGIEVKKILSDAALAKLQSDLALNVAAVARWTTPTGDDAKRAADDIASHLAIETRARDNRQSQIDANTAQQTLVWVTLLGQYRTAKGDDAAVPVALKGLSRPEGI